MVKKSHFHPEKLTIIEYRVLKGHVEASAEFNDDIELGYKITQSLELGFNLEAKLAKCELTFNIDTISKPLDQKEAKGTYQIFFIFKVDNFDDLVHQKSIDLPIDVDAVLAQHLAAISYSTSRGILLTKLMGTPFDKFMLPIVDPKNLLENTKT